MPKAKSLIVFFGIAALAGGLVYFFCCRDSSSVLGVSDAKNKTEVDFKSLEEKTGGNMEYSVDRNTGKITYLSGKAKGLPFSLKKQAKLEPASVAGQFMEEYGPYFGLQNPDKELKILAKEKDGIGMNHVTYGQTYQGIPVFGAEAIVHVKKDLSVSSANGKFVPDISLETNPKLSQKEAENKAGELWKSQFNDDAYQVVKTTLNIFNKGLVESKEDRKNYLTWEVELKNKKLKKHEFFFINAANGKLVYQITGIKKAIHRHVYDCTWGSCIMDYFFSGYYYGRSEGQSVRGANPVNGGTDVDDLYSITGDMHNYLSATFSRNGGNNQGGIGDGVYSAAANTDSFAYIDPMGWVTCPNAFWSGYDINFCKGLVFADSVGHEYGHGIVDFSVSGGLTYSGESGALHEGYADIFGEALENYRNGSSDWLMGEGINTGGLVGPLRNMQNPGALSDPDRFYSSDFYCGTADSGGVHTNSTVPGHAAYLMAMGGSSNGCTVSGIGREKQEKIFYRALTLYFTSSTDFNGAYDALNQACSDLYGSGSSECSEAKKALKAVEMDQGGACSAETQIQPCDSAPPAVSGVADGTTYNADVTITFNKGTATLNGASFSSGTTVSSEGSYALVVTDSVNETSTTVNFTISKASSSRSTLNYSSGKKAKAKIAVTFYGRNISTKKKWVSARLGGRKVKVAGARNSGSNFVVTLSFKYAKWPTGSYDLSVSYRTKSKTRGTLTSNGILTII